MHPIRSIVALGVVVSLAACAPQLLGPSVWLPDDGLPVPEEVITRTALPFCGVANLTADALPDEGREILACITGAGVAGRSAEAVIEEGDGPATDLTIVRTLPGGGVEIFYRHVGPGSVLWEVQTCRALRGDGEALVLVDPCDDAVLLEADLERSG